MATDGLDCDGALGLYDEALSMSQAMRAHNFYGRLTRRPDREMDRQD